MHFPDPYVVGFGWDEDGSLLYPYRDRAAAAAAAAAGSGGVTAAAAAGKADDTEGEPALTGAAAKTWFAGTEDDPPRDASGKFEYGWHWNSPYKVKRDIPDLFRKEVERYTGE